MTRFRNWQTRLPSRTTRVSTIDNWTLKEVFKIMKASLNSLKNKLQKVKLTKMITKIKMVRSRNLSFRISLKIKTCNKIMGFHTNHITLKWPTWNEMTSSKISQIKARTGLIQIIGTRFLRIKPRSQGLFKNLDNQELAWLTTQRLKTWRKASIKSSHKKVILSSRRKRKLWLSSIR